MVDSDQMKRILRCPKCEERGIKQSLAEINPSNGVIYIRRGYSKKTDSEASLDTTIVSGKDLHIICGLCATEVYRKKENK